MPDVAALLAEAARRAGPGARRARSPVGPVRAIVRRVRGAVLDARVAAMRAAAGLLGTRVMVRTVPGYEGSFELDTRSHVTRSVLAGAFEPEHAAFVRAAVDPQADAVDVGANCGLYTVLLARALAPGRRVLAVEPSPSVLPLLRANIARNGVADRVIVRETVLSDQPGVAVLHVREGMDEYASLGGPRHPNAPRDQVGQVHVPSETLDQVVASNGLRPALVKIDVEGAEGLVLSGATALLAELRPVVVLEIDDRLLPGLGWSAERVVRWLDDHGYDVWDVSDGSRIEVTTAGGFVGDAVAIPRKPTPS
jgi:FkbM family methyltransferase